MRVNFTKVLISRTSQLLLPDIYHFDVTRRLFLHPVTSAVSIVRVIENVVTYCYLYQSRDRLSKHAN